MYQFIMLIHVFAAICIVALVLVQQGKGATAGAAFGGGASSTVFGSRGSGSFLFRVTMSLIAVFFITSIGLNYIATQAYKQEKTMSFPAAPAQQIPAAPAKSLQEQIPATSAPAAALPLKSEPAPAVNIPAETNKKAGVM